MNEAHDLRRLHREAGPSPAADHPSPEALARAAADTGEAPDRLTVLDHVARCAECREDYQLLQAIATAEAADRAPAAPALPRRLALAALVVLALGVTVIWPRLRPSPDDRPRDGAASGPELVAPPLAAGSDQARHFVWRPIAGALRYELELLEVTGPVVATARVADTVFSLPDSVTLTPGGEYRWWVTAVWPDGTQLRAAARRLAITSP